MDNTSETKDSHWPAEILRPDNTDLKIPNNELISEQDVVKPTKKRYLILSMFVTLNIIKSFQWICLASITNVATKFYNVDNFAVNWTTIVFMVTFLTLSLPISCLMNFIGTRRSVIIGSLGVTLGVTLKCFSCHPEGFLLNFIGHLVIGFAEPFFFSIYAQLASIWFPDDQVSLATSIGIVGDQFGIALGFVIPSLVVGSDPDDMATVQLGLFRLSLVISIIASINSLLILLFFEEQPKYAPGIARLKQIHQQKAEKIERRNWTLKQRICHPMSELEGILFDKSFIMLLLGFGLNVGGNYALHTVLNQMMLAPFIISTDSAASKISNTEELATNHQVVGDAGLILIVSGIFGLMAFGRLLDAFNRFKLITVATYALSLICTITFTGGLYLRSELIICLLAIPLGFFITAYEGCGFEYGVELTYPKSELLASTLLNISAQIFGIPITFGASYAADTFGGLAAGLFFSAILLIGFVITCLQTGEFRRHNAIQQSIDGAQERPPITSVAC